MITTRYARGLAKVDAFRLLRALSHGTAGAELQRAAAEVDAAGDLGLTVAFKEVKVQRVAEGLRGKLLGEKGEIYVLTTALDGSGRPFEYKTQFFPGIKRAAKLPLGDGGMLVTYLTNPQWFIDVHMLVMESDSDVRQLGEFIAAARAEAKLEDAIGFVGSLGAFDPTAVAQVIKGVDIFLTALTYLLRQNGDDHIATIHDFYLKHQAFGQGRHPDKGTTEYQGVSAAYQMDLVPLDA
jgi:hypothetical protein